MGKRKKITIIIVELLIIFIAAVVLVENMKYSYIHTVDLADMTSKIEKLKYDGTSWHISNEDGKLYEGETYVFEGPGMALERGSYTVVIDYSSMEIHRAALEVESGVIDTADYFLLSNNKQEVRYDFALKTDVKGLKFILKNFNGGQFTLNGITIVRNSHDGRCLLFILAIIFILVDAYLFIKPIRNNITPIAIVIGIALLASLPLFPKGMMTGDDLRFHLVRIDAIAEGLRSGDFPVKMYPVYNDGYGYPVPILYGDILLYVPAILRLVGFPIMKSYKIYVFFVNILTAGFSFVCGKKIFRRYSMGTLFALSFTVSSYRMLCVYARAAVGEYSAMSFYPLIVLAIWNIYTQNIKEKKYKYNSILLAFGMAGLLYNHNLTLEMVGVTLIIFALVMYKKTFRKETFIVYVYSFGIFILITAAFIIPFIEYYSSVDILLKSMTSSDYYIQDNGAYLSDYFAVFKSITGGSYADRRGLHTPGLLLMAGLVLGLYLIVKKKATREIKCTCYGSIILLFTASTLCPWNRIYEIPFLGKMLTMVQFQYRYLGIAVCFMCLLLCLSIDRVQELGLMDKRIYGYAMFTGIIMMCFFLSEYQDERFITGNLRSYDTADLFVLSRDGEFGLYMTVGGQFLLEDTNVSKEALDYGVYGNNIKAVIIGENGLRLGVHVETTGDNASLEVPRFAYPHFIATDKYGNRLNTIVGHNNKVTVLFDKEYEGEVYIDFIEPWYWRVGELISLVSIIVIVVLLIVDKDTNKNNGENLIKDKF